MSRETADRTGRFVTRQAEQGSRTQKRRAEARLAKHPRKERAYQL